MLLVAHVLKLLWRLLLMLLERLKWLLLLEVECLLVNVLLLEGPLHILIRNGRQGGGQGGPDGRGAATISVSSSTEEVRSLPDVALRDEVGGGLAITEKWPGREKGGPILSTMARSRFPPA